MSPVVLIALSGAAFAGCLALGIAVLRKRSASHWLFAAGMALLGVETLLAGASVEAAEQRISAALQEWRLLCAAAIPGTWLLFSLCYARGDGPANLKRWRVPASVALLAPLMAAAMFHGRLTRLSEPWGTPRAVLELSAAGVVVHLLFLAGTILTLMNLERTYRASAGVKRWRIKFVILGLGFLLVARVYTCSQDLVFGAIDLPLQTVNASALLAACPLIVRSLLRSGHFQVEVYPSPTVLRHSVSVMAAGAYLTIVGAFANFAKFPGVADGFQLKALAILLALVLLTVLLVSDRFQFATRRLLSRHFQRPQHDYRTMWRTFTEGTARCVTPADLCRATVRLVSRIFQSLSVSLWLTDESGQRLQFGASTSLTEPAARSLEEESRETEQAIRAMKKRESPVDLDACQDGWASALRRLQPGEFRNGGGRIAVPMMAGGELPGILLLGDRVGGAAFSQQDLDLLSAAADQVAAGLLNIRLSQRLARSRQLEAFQIMSTFFVHDLKNTVSTLSLMLQNLPGRFDDREYRGDAIKAISRTTAHLQKLISRLSQLRRQIVVRPVESDINRLVSEVIEDLPAMPDGGLRVRLRPIPPVKADPERFKSVVCNLIQNARDAAPGPDGVIRVETWRDNGQVILTVADNGCGMTPEFIRNSLYRPFQTTKKDGVGIGMFQSRMIVEAHHCRLEVESAEGRGTTFNVLMPVEGGTR